MVVMICLLSFDRNWKIGKYVRYTYFEGIPRERKETYDPTTIIRDFMRLYYLIMTDINQSIIQRFILRHYSYRKLKYAYKGITFLRTQLTFLHVFEVFIDSDLYSKRIIYICWASKPEYNLYYKVYGLLGLQQTHSVEF